MPTNVADLNAFLAVARARSFRGGARVSGGSASGLSESVRRLEGELGVRLLHRTTRSVVPTEAGLRLLERLGPALAEVQAALDVVNGYRERPAGTLRLNVPVSAARLLLPAIVPPFLAAYPDIRLEVIADDGFVDMLAAGCDAGIRYDDRLEQDMIAVADRPARAALRHRGVARLSRPSRTAGAPARPARPCLPARAVRQRHDDHLGVRARRRGDPDRAVRSPSRAGRRGQRSRRRGGHRRHRHHPAFRGMAAAAPRQRRARTRARRLVAALFRPVLYYPGRRLLPAPLRAFVDFIKGGERG